MLKLAYIVSCHKNPSQINRMIMALDLNQVEAASDFYIHIDKKSNIRSKILTADNIFLIDDSKRINVRWGQISLVDTVLTLLRAVIDSKIEYDYIWFISGQDYPIKSKRDIALFFKENFGKNFMHCLDNESKIYRRFLKRNTICFPGWIESPHLLIKILRRLYIYVTGGACYTFPFFKRKPISHDYMKFYFGAQWFCVTYQCAKYILDYLNKFPSYYKFFKSAEIPDECFFQTIFFNSPFCKESLDYLCYVDWNEHKRHPRVLTTKDFVNLNNSKYLIARKFDSSVDNEIFNILDRHNI